MLRGVLTNSVDTDICPGIYIVKNKTILLVGVSGEFVLCCVLGSLGGNCEACRCLFVILFL